MKLLDANEKIYLLDNENFNFPIPSMMGGDLVALGGDFHPQRLINAYHSGIFPWFIDEHNYIHWFSPQKRMVLYPDEFKLSKSLRRTINNKNFEVKVNQQFTQVMQECAKSKRKHQEGTWITDDFIWGYTNLYELGYAFSIETYLEDELVGGLYGVLIGDIFCGESMFAKTKDASKVALYQLAKSAKESGITLIDCQVYTDHLASLGAKEIDREEYFSYLQRVQQSQPL